MASKRTLRLAAPSNRRATDSVSRLASDTLFKILGYLDASSLLCVSHVNKVLHQVANDDTIWHKLYLSEIGEDKKRRPRGAVGSAPPMRRAGTPGVAAAAPTAVRVGAAGPWKRKYLRWMASCDNADKWKIDLRVVDPYTGLPSQTESALRKLCLSWELTMNARGLVAEMELFTVAQTHVRFFPSAVTVCWDRGGGGGPFSHLSSLQLHAVARAPPSCPSFLHPLYNFRPGWRSLMNTFDTDGLSKPSAVIGGDALVEVLLLHPGLAVGVLRGSASIAFIIACFHFHQLVERSLLGSSACPYSVPVAKAPFDDIDPEYGLHDYTLNIVLHNTVAEIMSGQFTKLFCRKAWIQDGHIELVAISRSEYSQSVALTGDISLPWRCEALGGTVENCCIMSLTLLGEAGRPFWCVSSPVAVTLAEKDVQFEYGSERFAVRYVDPDGGRATMELVHTVEQKQLLLVDLRLHIALPKVNRHFGTSY